MSTGDNVPVERLDDNEVALFVKEKFPDVKFDHVKNHDVDDENRLYRMGSGDEDDLLHILVGPSGKYRAYLPNEDGAMRSVETGVIPIE